MKSGLKYRNGPGYAPLYVYAQMGIDSAMVASINEFAVEQKYISDILTALQAYVGMAG